MKIDISSNNNGTSGPLEFEIFFKLIIKEWNGFSFWNWHISSYRNFWRRFFLRRIFWNRNNFLYTFFLQGRRRLFGLNGFGSFWFLRDYRRRRWICNRYIYNCFFYIRFKIDMNRDISILSFVCSSTWNQPLKPSCSNGLSGFSFSRFRFWLCLDWWSKFGGGGI